ESIFRDVAQESSIILCGTIYDKMWPRVNVAWSNLITGAAWRRSGFIPDGVDPVLLLGALIAGFFALCANFKQKIAMGHPGPRRRALLERHKAIRAKLSPTELPALETARATPQQSSRDASTWGQKRPRTCLGRGAQQQLSMDQQQLQDAQHQLAVDQQQLQGAQHQLAVDQQQLQNAQHQLAVDQQQLQNAQHQLAVDQQQLQNAQHQLAVDQQLLQGSQHQLAVDLEQLQGAQHQLGQALEQLQNGRTGLERSEILLRQHMDACMRAPTMDSPSYADMQPCSHAAMHSDAQPCNLPCNQPCTTMQPGMQPAMQMHSHAQPCTAMHSHAQPCTAMQPEMRRICFMRNCVPSAAAQAAYSSALPPVRLHNSFSILSSSCPGHANSPVAPVTPTPVARRAARQKERRRLACLQKQQRRQRRHQQHAITGPRILHPLPPPTSAMAAPSPDDPNALGSDGLPKFAHTTSQTFGGKKSTVAQVYNQLKGCTVRANYVVRISLIKKLVVIACLLCNKELGIINPTDSQCKHDEHSKRKGAPMEQHDVAKKMVVFVASAGVTFACLDNPFLRAVFASFDAVCPTAKQARTTGLRDAYGELCRVVGAELDEMLQDLVGQDPVVWCQDPVGQDPVVWCQDPVCQDPVVWCQDPVGVRQDPVGQDPVVWCQDPVVPGPCGVCQDPVVWCQDPVGQNPVVWCQDPVDPVVWCQDPAVWCQDPVGQNPVVWCQDPVDPVGQDPVVRCQDPVVWCQDPVGQNPVDPVGQNPVVWCQDPVGQDPVVWCQDPVV
ncbi:hypothetical protein QJQ45_029181, partial [Haematococcus lacustris]